MSALEPSAIETPSPPARVKVTAYVVPDDITLAELNSLASILADKVPGRYEVDFLNGELIFSDGSRVTGGCVVLVIGHPSGASILLASDVDVVRLLGRSDATPATVITLEDS